jgi:hypothetical protein
MISTNDGAVAGHFSLSWTSVVSTWGGFIDAAAFSRNQRSPRSIVANITPIGLKD